MEILKRINLETVKEAFDHAGITPARSNPQRCIMAAILYPRIASYANARRAGFDLDYYDGVLYGWDVGKPIPYKNLKYNLGVSDGTIAASIMGIQHD